MSMPTSTTTSQKPESGFSYAAAASGKQKTTATPTVTMASAPVDSPSDLANTSEMSNGATAAQSEASLEKPTTTAESSANTSSPNEITGKEDKEGCMQEEKQNGWDKQSQTSSGQVAEAIKSKEFVPAPAPAVNVWKVRQEAQAAKTKAAPTPSSASPAPVVPETTVTASKPVKDTENTKKKGPKSAGSSNWDQSKANGNDKNHTREQRERKKTESTKEKTTNGPTREEGEGKQKAGKSSKSQAHAATNLPSLADANSWPTPENAKEDNKEKKPRDESREKPVSGSKSDKTNWTRMEIDATAVYSVSPKATRSGRSGRGANRAGFDSSKGANGQKYTADGTQSATDNDRGRTSHGEKPSRGGHFNGRGGKRAPSAGNAPSKKPNHPHPHGSENRKEETTLAQTNTNTTVDSVAPPSDAKPSDAISPSQTSPKTNVEKPERQQAFGVAPVLPVNASGNPNFEANPLRERNANSGRGGYRGGRGNSHFNGAANGGHQAVPNTPSTQPFSGSHQARNNYQLPRGQRVSNPSFQRFSLPTTYPMQSYPANYDMNGAGPIHGYIPSSQMQSFDAAYIREKLTSQVEYYFSIDNLCKDMYLRKCMDSQGFVKLSIILGFHKVSSLTLSYEQLKDAVLASTVVELATSQAGEGLRRKEDWQPWVLSLEQRENFVPDPPGPWTVIAARPAVENHQNFAPPPSQIRNNYGNGYHGEQTNGHVLNTYGNNNNWYSHSHQMQHSSAGVQKGLSAEVPAFTPSKKSAKQAPQGDTYPDSDLDRLVIVCSRVFGPANGSVNADAPASTYHQIPASEIDPTLVLNNDAEALCETLGWIDPRDETNKVQIPAGSLHIGYTQFVANVLEERKEKRNTLKMAILYRFWSHFLLCHFNRSTYLEFRQLAMDDNKTGQKPGFDCYLAYLKAAHKASQQPPLLLTNDLIDLSKMSPVASETVKSLFNDPAVPPATKSQIEARANRK